MLSQRDGVRAASKYHTGEHALKGAIKRRILLSMHEDRSG